MARTDPRVDAYIARSAEFARPILKYLRDAVDAGCPGVAETIKWGMPYFDYHGLMCHMAAFKGHCVFGFWKAALVFGHEPTRAGDAMGQFGRITRLDDLPSRRILVDLVKKAARLNKEGMRVPPPPAPRRRADLSIPADLGAALKRNRKALNHFTEFSYSHKKEYLEWITGAKREATRRARLEAAIALIAEGKSRH